MSVADLQYLAFVCRLRLAKYLSAHLQGHVYCVWAHEMKSKPNRDDVSKDNLNRLRQIRDGRMV